MGLRGKSRRRVLAGVMMAAVAAGIATPLPCRGVEQAPVVHFMTQEPGEPQQPKNDPPRRGVVGLDDKGDLIIRCGGFHVILAYNPADDLLKYPDATYRTAPRQDSAVMNGISARLVMTF